MCKLCHNYWNGKEQISKTKILYSFGRKDKLDVEKIKSLIDSLSKLIKPEDISPGIPGRMGDIFYLGTVVVGL